MSSPFLTISLTRGLSKSARTARSCSSSPGLYRFSTTRRSKCSSFLFPHQMIQRDRKIEEHPRLLHRAGYPHRFCPRHDVLGSTHGAHQCTIQLVQPHTRAAAAASHPCVKNRRRTPPHRSTSMVLASCCIYSHVTPHHLTSRQSLRCTRHLGARWRDFDFPASSGARASLDEVLAHRWMNPTLGPRSLLGDYKAADATTHAALRWPEKVDHVLFRAPADDARRKQNLADILELIARLCEAPNTRRPT
ncbi:hypothetical protein EDB84DRAFT_600329 [Lactarius hengduanensis]|nr:hypothetical protein EDB84DRAFT_600329 [Lactarius hengduanensis]